MKFKNLISFFKNVYNVLKNDMENVVTIFVTLAIVLICSLAKFPVLGFALTSSILFGRSVLGLFRNVEIRKVFNILISQQIDLIKKIDELKKDDKGKKDSVTQTGTFSAPPKKKYRNNKNRSNKNEAS